MTDTRNTYTDISERPVYGSAWVPISAFNLIEGAAFRLVNAPDQGHQIFVVTKVLYRSSNAERIGVLVRVLGEWEQTVEGDFKGERVGKYDTFSFDFMHTVRLVGLSTNPDSWDDLDIGQVNS